MDAANDFSPADTVESEVFGLNFVNDLQSGEILLSVVGGTFLLTVSENSPGVDAAVGTRLVGSATIAVPPDETTNIGAIQRIATLQPNVLYVLQGVVLTSLGNTKSLYSHIFCEKVN